MRACGKWLYSKVWIRTRTLVGMGAVSFPGHEGIGYSFTVAIGRKKIATYTEYGNGGEPDLNEIYITNDDKGNAWRKAEIDKLYRYATENAPYFYYAGNPCSGGFGMYFETVLAYYDLEKQLKKIARRYPAMPYVGLLLYDKAPESFVLMLKDDIEKAAERLIGKEDAEGRSIAVIKAPVGGVLVLEDGLPEGVPVSEFQGGKR